MYNKNLLIFIIFLALFFYGYGSIRLDNKWESTEIKYHVDYYAQYFDVFEAFREIEKYTCFKFIYKNDMITNENGINVVGTDDCTIDHDGMKRNNKPNFIYIGRSCNNKGHVLSFILQVLGVDDEHNRIDRDRYVKIREEKMEPRYREYFQKDDTKITEIFDTNYDYGSITHGSPRLYLRWAGGETIKVIGNHTEYYQKMIGQRYSVSFNEYKLVNYLYCNKTCELTEQKPECWFGGYQNPNKCNECLCPYPLYGYRCQSLTSDNKGYCPYTSVSPAPYETLLKYYGYRHCSTIIQAPEKHQRIQIIVEHVWLSDNEFCARGDSMLEIKYKEDKSLMGLCFCNHVKDYKIISESNIVIITYHGYRFSQSADVTYKLV